MKEFAALPTVLAMSPDERTAYFAKSIRFLPDADCDFCVGGLRDSGGTTPWGEGIFVTCHACRGSGKRPLYNLCVGSKSLYAETPVELRAAFDTYLEKATLWRQHW